MYVLRGDGEVDRRRQSQMRLRGMLGRGREPLKGNNNLYLRLARQEEEDHPPEEESCLVALDPALWKGLPALLLLKILVDHLPLDRLFRLADGDWELTAAILAQPLKRDKYALLLPNQSLVLHNFGGVEESSASTPRDLPPRWKRFRIRLDERDGQSSSQRRLLAVSPRGLLVLYCTTGEGDAGNRHSLLCYSLDPEQPQHQASVLLPAEYDHDGGGVQACQVVHPGCKDDQWWYQIVILYAAGSKALVFDSRSLSWNTVRKASAAERDVFITSSCEAIHLPTKSISHVVLPLGLHCQHPEAIQTQDSTYLFLVAAIGKATADYRWARTPALDAANGIHENSPVVLGGLRMDGETGDWELLPGPRDEVCRALVLPELWCLGVAGCVGVFVDSKKRLLSCLVDPWSWYISSSVKSWNLDGKIIQIVSP
ncbi:hypothetical protein SELMODRAFT_411159 [Selaginella moellendorffii]|uniref:Uncharacterized protein n=1 Tax=Selaginella moellendorffii TaxID=88036 RepID=D8RGR6_SELML|nr:uncharacterized protein LOC9632208 [Selaginella moellendorffii]EFJ28412.1 hypothetical protein SELMODRAFT_411159 [Selaginella moellendorffii]|eukprot:XP_002970282.1 uncharacterized protein LOC9632208 [Selaginella moellendorffii]